MVDEISVNKPKISVIKGQVRHKFSVFYNNLIRNEDFKSFLGIAFEIIFCGLLLNLALILFGVPFRIVEILACGSLFWLLSFKIVPMLVNILNSFRLAVVYK